MAISKPCALAAEIAEDNDALRRNLAGIIRGRSGLTAAECAQFEQHGLRFDGGDVTWRHHQVKRVLTLSNGTICCCAFQVLTGSIEPITAEELAEAMASGETLESLLAEFDRLYPNVGEAKDK